jgi:hypothetical protein
MTIYVNPSDCRALHLSFHRVLRLDDVFPALWANRNSQESLTIMVERRSKFATFLKEEQYFAPSARGKPIPNLDFNENPSPAALGSRVFLRFLLYNLVPAGLTVRLRTSTRKHACVPTGCLFTRTPHFF